MYDDILGDVDKIPTEVIEAIKQSTGVDIREALDEKTKEINCGFIAQRDIKDVVSVIDKVYKKRLSMGMTLPTLIFCHNDMKDKKPAIIE